jgi:hypothetical protein
MSLVATPPPVSMRKPFMRPATALVWAVSLAGLLLIATHVVDAGFVRRDIEDLRAGEAWQTGGWLSQLVLSLVGLIPNIDWQQTVLSLAAAVLAGLGFGVLYDRLRANGWTIVGSVVMLLLLATHANALYAITAASRGLPLYFAIATLIPAIRKMEDVGDVQSTISLGLLMPLVLLAGPVSTALILPLAVGAALADPDGRRDPRAFVAMLLVAVIPSLIVAIGVVGFAAQSGLGLESVVLPYLVTYGGFQQGDVAFSLGVLFTFAPVAVVPLLYCIWPKLPEKRHVWSALAVVAMPVWLATARVTFNSPMQPFVPAVALLGGYISWLCVARLPVFLRALAMIALGVAVIASWTQTSFWDDPAWKSALFTSVDFGNLNPLPGV